MLLISPLSPRNNCILCRISKSQVYQIMDDNQFKRVNLCKRHLVRIGIEFKKVTEREGSAEKIALLGLTGRKTKDD